MLCLLLMMAALPKQTCHVVFHLDDTGFNGCLRLTTNYHFAERATQLIIKEAQKVRQQINEKENYYGDDYLADGY